MPKFLKTKATFVKCIIWELVMRTFASKVNQIRKSSNGNFTKIEIKKKKIVKFLLIMLLMVAKIHFVW